MGNTRPLGMASGKKTATSWCSHCGMGLAAPSAESGSGVRCAFCHWASRVGTEHQRGVGESATTRALNAAASLPRPVSSGLVEIPSGYPRVSGSKRALLVGVSYTGTAHELKGTVNDVKEMKSLLCNKFGFPGGCILELTGNVTMEFDRPTDRSFVHELV